MTNRRYLGNGIISSTGTPENAINDAFNKGYWREAFSLLDAEIDKLLESGLRSKYNESKEQDVINAFIQATKKRGFAEICMKILVKEKIISGNLKSNIQKFKEIRNIVLHNVFPANEILQKRYKKWWETITTEEQFKNTFKNILGNDLRTALGNWRELLEINRSYSELKK